MSIKPTQQQPQQLLSLDGAALAARLRTSRISWATTALPRLAALTDPIHPTPDTQQPSSSTPQPTSSSHNEHGRKPVIRSDNLGTVTVSIGPHVFSGTTFYKVVFAHDSRKRKATGSVSSVSGSGSGSTTTVSEVMQGQKLSVVSTQQVAGGSGDDKAAVVSVTATSRDTAAGVKSEPVLAVVPVHPSSTNVTPNTKPVDNTSMQPGSSSRSQLLPPTTSSTTSASSSSAIPPAFAAFLQLPPATLAAMAPFLSHLLPQSHIKASSVASSSIPTVPGATAASSGSGGSGGGGGSSGALLLPRPPAPLPPPIPSSSTSAHTPAIAANTAAVNPTAASRSTLSQQQLHHQALKLLAQAGFPSMLPNQSLALGGVTRPPSTSTSTSSMPPVTSSSSTAIAPTSVSTHQQTPITSTLTLSPSIHKPGLTTKRPKPSSSTTLSNMTQANAIFQQVLAQQIQAQMQIHMQRHLAQQQQQRGSMRSVSVSVSGGSGSGSGSGFGVKTEVDGQVKVSSGGGEDVSVCSASSVVPVGQSITTPTTTNNPVTASPKQSTATILRKPLRQSRHDGTIKDPKSACEIVFTFRETPGTFFHLPKNTIYETRGTTTPYHIITSFHLPVKNQGIVLHIHGAGHGFVTALGDVLNDVVGVQRFMVKKIGVVGARMERDGGKCLVQGIRFEEISAGVSQSHQGHRVGAVDSGSSSSVVVPSDGVAGSTTTTTNTTSNTNKRRRVSDADDAGVVSMNAVEDGRRNTKMHKGDTQQPKPLPTSSLSLSVSPKAVVVSVPPPPPLLSSTHTVRVSDAVHDTIGSISGHARRTDTTTMTSSTVSSKRSKRTMKNPIHPNELIGGASPMSKPIQNTSNRNRHNGVSCMHCGVVSTSAWRRGPLGPCTLCHACGVSWRYGQLVFDETVLSGNIGGSFGNVGGGEKSVESSGSAFSISAADAVMSGSGNRYRS